MKESSEKKMDVNKIEVFHKFDHNWAFIWKVFKKIMPMPFLVWLIYVQSFMMFPEINGLSVTWSSAFLILTFKSLLHKQSQPKKQNHTPQNRPGVRI